MITVLAWFLICLGLLSIIIGIVVAVVVGLEKLAQRKQKALIQAIDENSIKAIEAILVFLQGCLNSQAAYSL